MPEFFKLVTDAVAQAPMIALLVYILIQVRKDLLTEVKYLKESNDNKDERIEELLAVIDKFTITLELIKDRLR